MRRKMYSRGNNLQSSLSRATVKLLRLDDDKIGLVVELSSGPHVVAGIGALMPGDPISHGVLHGLNGSWPPLIQLWKMATPACTGS
jgi:hypothetical protein